MTARMKRCVTFVTVVMTLFLSACRMDGTVEIHSDGSAETVFVFEDDDGKAERIHRTCEGLQKRLALVGRFAKATMEDITPPGGHLTCKSTLSGYLYDEVKFYETKDSYSLTFSPLKKVKPEENYIKPTLTISMPGKVVKTSMGEVVGNKVIIKGFGYTTKTLSIVAEKEGAKSVSSSDSFPSSAGGATSASSPTGGSGFPVWGWGGVGAGAFALVLVAGVLIGRRKRRTAPPSLNLSQR